MILLPLFQKQWLNLYLFDINNFTIYKLLYYLSGLIVPIIVMINSLNNFTFYKFNKTKVNLNNVISGKSLFLITFSILIVLSILISSYIFGNLRIISNLFLFDNTLLVNFDVDKYILFIIVISISLIFKKLRLFIKKVSLINFFIISIIIWYSQVNNIILKLPLRIDFLKFDNFNFINLLFFLLIEIFYYLCSYISNSTYLSDWRLPVPCTKDIMSIVNILFFYLLIIVYYSILF